MKTFPLLYQLLAFYLWRGAIQSVTHLLSIYVLRKDYCVDFVNR